VTRAPTKGTVAGRAYLALQKKARADGRRTDELLHLFALEAFLDRLANSTSASALILKGGVLLAAYEMRRPTRDVDLAGLNIANSVEATVALVGAVLSNERDDGWVFGPPSGTTIRDEDQYSGVRVTIPCELARARLSFHVDVNFGDPIWPDPEYVVMPRLLGGELRLRGYPLVMIYAEKLVTSVQRGIANTRWRDIADVYLLSSRHTVSANELRTALAKVAQHRKAELTSLALALEGFSALGQARWALWVRGQQMQDRLPLAFAEVLDNVLAFADPVLDGRATDTRWDPSTRTWSPS